MSRNAAVATASLTAAFCAVWAVVPAAVPAASASPSRFVGPRAAAAGGTWGKAKEVPGLGTLNAGGGASVLTVSCASPGNCAAGGAYRDGSGHNQAFVVSQRSGGWRPAKEVAGALDAGNNAGVQSVSCASPGNCSAGGHYFDIAGHIQAFVISENGGRWGTAKPVPGLLALNQGGISIIKSVSCAAAGDCVAGGDYRDGSGNFQAFLAIQKNGTWGKPVIVAKSLNVGGGAQILTVSCPSAGNCGAAGNYADASGKLQAFVTSEKNGTWGKAKPIAGLISLNAGGFAAPFSVSCASAGNCSAGGYYSPGGSVQRAFVVSEKKGTWGKVRHVADSLNSGGYAYVGSVSCASVGNCGAGGLYRTATLQFQALVLNEVNGRWHKAAQVAGTLNAGGDAAVNWVSCVSAGNCVAGGYYKDASGKHEAFVVSEVNGTWRKAIEVPGIGTLNVGGNGTVANAAVNAVSCTTAGHCSAGGAYVDGSGHSQAFVVTES